MISSAGKRCVDAHLFPPAVVRMVLIFMVGVLLVGGGI